MLRRIVQPEEGERSCGDGEQAFNHKHPEPAGMAHKPMHLQQRAG